MDSKKMKTLYVSDLDGTLLQPDAKLSQRTVELLNESIGRGTLFTVATARTPATMAPILKDVKMQLPAIVMTGAALWNPATRLYSCERHISAENAARLIEIYKRTDTPTFVYILADNMVDIHFLGKEMNTLQRTFIEERVNNPFKRLHTQQGHYGVDGADLDKVILLYTMLPDAKAAATYEELKKVQGVRPQYYHDIFGPEVGILEAFSADATKANAVRRLAQSVGADRVVAFGDNINDLPMLHAANLAVAVENAIDEVKEVADIVIGKNVEDSVARFIHAGL